MNNINVGVRVLYYEDGDLIFGENSVINEMHVIESGGVELSKRINGKKTPIAILKEGDFFGEMVLFKDIPQDLTAMALGKTTLIALSQEELLKRMQNNLQFSINILQSLMNRLRNANSMLVALITRINDFNNSIINGLILEKRSLSIGEILIEMGFLTNSQLERALQKQKEKHLLSLEHKLLGEIMMEMGMITEAQLRNGLAEQQMRFRSEK